MKREEWGRGGEEGAWRRKGRKKRKGRWRRVSKRDLKRNRVKGEEAQRENGGYVKEQKRWLRRERSGRE